MKNLILILTLLFSFVGQAQLRKSTESYVSQNGKNFLKNPGFEQYTAGWVNSGGTKAILTGSGDVGEGNRAARFTAAGSAEYFESELSTLSNIGKAQGGCMADFYYKDGDGFDIKIYDGASNLLLSQNIAVAASDWTKTPTLTFQCADQLKIRLESTGAGIIDIDKVYLGSNKGVGPVSIQTDLASYGPLTITATGSAPTKGTIIEDDISCGRDGQFLECHIEFHQSIAGSAGSGDYLIGIPSGFEVDMSYYNMDGNSTASKVRANAIGTGILGNNSNTNSTSVMPADIIIYDSTKFRVLVFQGTGVNTRRYWESANYGLNGADTYFTGSFRVPIVGWKSGTVQAFTPDAAEFFIDANIGSGGSNVAPLATSTPVILSNSDLDLVLKSGSAKIGCSGGNAATGLTCSAGSEQAALVVSLPTSGRYKACSTVSFEGTTGQGLNLRMVTTTAPDNDIIDQVGSQNGGYSSGSTVTNGNGINVCGWFNLSAGEHKIALSYEAQTANGVFLIDRAGVQYERDISITVELVGNNVSRPILTGDTVTSPGLDRPAHFACFITQNGTAALASPMCNSWVDNVSTVSTGRVEWTINSAQCTTIPIVQITPSCGSSTEFKVEEGASTNTFFRTQTFNSSGTVKDCDIHVSMDCLR